MFHKIGRGVRSSGSDRKVGDTMSFPVTCLIASWNYETQQKLRKLKIDLFPTIKVNSQNCHVCILNICVRRQHDRSRNVAPFTQRGRHPKGAKSADMMTLYKKSSSSYLPSLRALTETRGVHRHTVLAGADVMEIISLAILAQPALRSIANLHKSSGGTGAAPGQRGGPCQQQSSGGTGAAL